LPSESLHSINFDNRHAQLSLLLKLLQICSALPNIRQAFTLVSTSSSSGYQQRSLKTNPKMSNINGASEGNQLRKYIIIIIDYSLKIKGWKHFDGKRRRPNFTDEEKEADINMTSIHNSNIVSNSSFVVENPDLISLV
jgi:hypothetical protein